MKIDKTGIVCQFDKSTATALCVCMLSAREKEASLRMERLSRFDQEAYDSRFEEQNQKPYTHLGLL
ncbi:hypothetical protein T09_14348 [Trichinella sp. T9]|nr:hypothetical protein T09_14348 [Trichinella sp. T9]